MKDFVVELADEVDGLDCEHHVGNTCAFTGTIATISLDGVAVGGTVRGCYRLMAESGEDES